MKFKIFISFLMLSLAINASAEDFELGATGKIIKMVGGDRLTNEMSSILSEELTGVFYLKDAFDKANTYSTIICNVENEPRHSRDEVDAVRHFIGSSILSAYFGPDFARRLLTAHEKRRAEFDEENYMDLSNNEVGYAFGPEIPVIFKVRRSKRMGSPMKTKAKVKSFDTSLEFFRTAVFNKLKNGELYTLESGKSACTFSELYPNM